MNITPFFTNRRTSCRRSGCAAGTCILLALCGGLELVTSFFL